MLVYFFILYCLFFVSTIYILSKFTINNVMKTDFVATRCSFYNIYVGIINVTL